VAAYTQRVEARMTATIVPFPVIRRRAFVRRHAAIMAALTPEAAERHLRRQVAIQTAAMERRGIHASVIDLEREALDRAIRAECQRVQTLGAA